jgi:hypothetical protein
MTDPLSRLRHELQRLHRHRGEPSVRDIARRTGGAITHSTVHAVLQCAKAPRWGPLELVVEALDGGIDEFRRLWVVVRDAQAGIGSGAAVGEAEPAPGPPGLPDWRGSGSTAPVCPDRVVHGYLVEELHQLRKAEDGVGARMVLTPVLAQVPTIAAVRAAADGRLHDDLLSLEAQWAQFCGWLYQDLGDRAASEQWYARALGQAHETGDDNLVASVLSMRANAAWGAGDMRRSTALSKASCRVGGTSPGVRALSVQQLARAYALAGDRAGCERAMAEAARLSALAAADPEREPPWIYYQTPNRFEIQRGMCYRDLGLHEPAIEVLARAIAELPAAYRRDRGQYLARLALAFAQAGEREQAVATAQEARELAVATGSARTTTELDRLAGVLSTSPAAN